ncbi:MAG TPA: ABC transporter ATP-binding protein [Amaricoccus sp.]|uniref:ABC transporter ATP-binding protein n=1 Tax=Amaricoccus sp. TaxID=1872485 RepID=UPI002C90DD60|nr:ABC transporter ATP-binding protein [Amaricoccus sp.]HMQ95278.1 ABC transporter ATP-binding protein [Amaricoccus sp.]HMR52390.1 ABC transporter ATP-binding protein [Amaricoccus sp.]HMR59224.1 ABC transporter ATP-binding protein [Amaricoccus sp.]HMT99311.1 ABC transporter ATP-binding protein [Amaricoccus sp.]
MPTIEDPIVHIDGISKSFGRTVALQKLDMKIDPGEFVTFLGPSGCGKSTTLRILGGFAQPDSGRIVLGGEDVTRLPPNKRKVNMVFQDYALFPHMTVTRNVTFGLELKRMTRDRIAARVDELLSFLELDAFRDRFPDQLSGGQRQRVALARALAPDPDLLLLDEPLGALDARLRAQVQLELKDIQRRTGKTFFFVTHDQDEALTMSDRIVVMNQGRVEQDGTPEDLYLRPKSRFVAEFIGETNLLSGPVRHAEDDRVAIDWFGMQIEGRAFDRTPRPGDVVTAALRLEKVGFYDARPETGNAVPGRVVNRVFKGSRTAVDVRVGDAGAAILKAYVDRDVPDDVWLGWESANLAVLQD